MSGVKIGIGFGQWKYGYPTPNSCAAAQKQQRPPGLIRYGCPIIS